jgi:FecR protein
MKGRTTQTGGDQLLSEMVKLVQTTFPQAVSGDDRGLARLEQTWHRRALHSKGPTIRNPRSRVLVAALATAALTAGWFFFHGKADDLTYEVLNGAVDPAGFVRSNASGTKILFSEGSEIALDESARTRVESVTADGGRVVVESGSVRARIVHRNHSRWLVAAGPYVIRVTGTAFNVKWSWADELLDIRLDRGSVVVVGPLAPEGVTLTAGMRLTANPRSGLAIGDSALAKAGGSVGLSASRFPPTFVPTSRSGSTDDPGDHGPSNQPPSDDGAKPSANLAPRTDIGPEPGPGFRPVLRRKSAHDRDGISGRAPRPGGASGSAEIWERRLARGDVQGILDDAEARGIDRILASASQRDLSALADAARYGQRPHLARRVLVSMRARFSGTPEARDAAFFLGALTEDAAGPGGQLGALEWYDRYLGESAEGRYAAQALGRKMVMAQKLKGPQAARAVADEYLRRFPQGPYAAAARNLSRSTGGGS